MRGSSRFLGLALAGCSLVVFEPNAPHDYASVVRADAPASMWRFEGNAHDEFARANAETTNVTYVDGALHDKSKAARFDGSSIVAAPDVYAFTGNAPFTIEMWLAPDARGGDTQRVCNHRQGEPMHTGWLLYLDKRTRAVFERWDRDAIVGRVSADIGLDVYSHVVVRYDGAELAMYLDGDRKDAVADAHALGTFAAPLTWGVSSTQVLDFFTGRIDEAAIYERALDPTRIRAHYEAGAHGKF